MTDKQATFFATYGLFALPIAAGSTEWRLPLLVVGLGLIAWFATFSRDGRK